MSVDIFRTDLLCWSPERDWHMVLAGEPGQVIRLHEAHFFMTTDGCVLKNAYAISDLVCNDGLSFTETLREEGLRVLEGLCKSA